MKRVRADATGIKKIEMDGYRGGGGGVLKDVLKDVAM